MTIEQVRLAFENAITVPPADEKGDAWNFNIIKGKNGPKPILFNAVMVLATDPVWQGVLAFDEFTSTAMAISPPPWILAVEKRNWRPRPWSDHDDLALTAWFQTNGLHLRPEVAAQAVQLVAGWGKYHPVRRYLENLKWDGTCRIDSWMVRFLGAENCPYVRAVGRKFLIGAVARVFQPGCKLDTAPVLEGPQGLGKSAVVRALGEPWFTDEIAAFGSKDAAEQIIGAWIMELAEMESLTRPEVASIKAFMSRSEDRFRPAYGRRVQTFARQCVFVGTVNSNDYLRDETGGRRFWPVACKKADAPAVRLARDQLWAEAVVRYHEGEKWWMDTPTLVEAAKTEQADRYQGDPWDGIIAAFVAGDSATGALAPSPRQSVSINEVLSDALQIEKGRQTQQDQNRVARCLKAMGWTRRQIRRPDGGREWRYHRPSHQSGESGDKVVTGKEE